MLVITVFNCLIEAFRVLRSIATNVLAYRAGEAEARCPFFHPLQSLERLTCPYLAISLSALSARTLITFRAGLALNITSCLVNGLIPLRALVAGF